MSSKDTAGIDPESDVVDMKYQDIVPNEHPAHGTMLTCWTVMAKTMIGVALLGLSSAVATCGWIVGSVLLIVAAISAMFTLHLLNCMIMQSEKRHVSFYVVAERVAPWTRWIVDLAIAVKSLGVGTAYFQVYANETISFILRMNSGVTEVMSESVLRFLVVFTGLLLMLPICYRKSVSKTAIINVCGIIGVTYIVVIGIFYTDVDYIDPSKPLSDSFTSVWPTGSFAAVAAKIPIFIFTFTCHQNMFLVGEDMKERTQRKLDLVALLAELVGICLFIPAMICPYITYGKSVSSNFLTSMNTNPNIAMNASVLCGSLAIAVAEISAFPLQLFPCRKSIMVLVTRGQPMTVDYEKKLRRIFTSVILSATCIIAMLVSDLGITLCFVGIVGSNTICFIMPSFLYCCAFDRRDENIAKRIKWYASATVCAITTSLLPICLSAIIYMTATK
jgi:amino acid permease